MLLTTEQIYLLLDRLKWEPVYETDTLVLAEKRRGGYSKNEAIAQIEVSLSIMGQAAASIRKTK